MSTFVNVVCGSTQAAIIKRLKRLAYQDEEGCYVKFQRSSVPGCEDNPGLFEIKARVTEERLREDLSVGVKEERLFYCWHGQ